MGENSKITGDRPESRVLNFIREERLVSPGQKLVVAVSGGPDSVCLLHILHRLKEELGIDLHIAHLNHKLRGAEAEADAEYVTGLAGKLGVPATIEARDTKSYHTRTRATLEEAARIVRYRFLADVARAVQAERVAVGHTADDHVETILMHLIRGGGTRGLRGLVPFNCWQGPGTSLNVIRPLLPLSRRDTSAYCGRHRLKPRTDATNASLVPFRNKIRHELLPKLASYNPRIAEALIRTARIAADDLEFIEGEVDRLWGTVAHKKAHLIVLDKTGFLALPPSLKRHLLRSSIEALLGNLKDIEAVHIEAMMDALNKPTGKRICLPGNLTFTVNYDRYVLCTDRGEHIPIAALEDEHELEIPGNTRTHRWDIEATILEPDMEKAQDNANILTAYFDLGKTGAKLSIRDRRPGDRFQPLGMNQLKKLNEFMIDAKIPRTLRSQMPIVYSPEKIIWVVGCRIDERAKVTETTRQVLRLKFSRR